MRDDFTMQFYYSSQGLYDLLHKLMLLKWAAVEEMFVKLKL